MENISSQDVLAFWFSSAQKSRWYAKDEQFDAEIRQRFLATYEAAYAGELDKWRSTPESLLALIILLDQFPRNMFRGSPRAFASDAYAVRLTKEGIERGFHGWMKWAEDNEASIVDLGSPLGKTKRIDAKGISDTKNEITAYTIVQAESHEAAAGLFENHPHFMIFPGQSVEVMECLPLPKM